MTIQDKLQNLTTASGIYQMLDKNSQVLYVGKAKNLKNRVSQYFNKSTKDNKTMTLVSKICNFEVIVVETETSALLLENQLIKQYQPKYNILLKDSKTFPHIFISNDLHPRIGLSRLIKKQGYAYFGPYTNVGVVRNAIDILKKIFKIRTCVNSVYKSRSRPCLEHQIGLCSAPCVNKISIEDYKQDSENMLLFLNGKSKIVLKNIEQKMQNAAQKTEYEIAAYYRDQMSALRTLQEKHNASAQNDMDIVYLAKYKKKFGVQILFIRSGKQIGSQMIFPKNILNHINSHIMSAFLTQYYAAKQTPTQIIISENIADKKLLQLALKSKIINRLDKNKKHFMNIAKLTSKQNLINFLQGISRKQKQLLELQKVLSMKDSPKVIECFDISHTMGEATVASCVVFKDGAPLTKNYRQFAINNITAGDDYAAMREVVYRRYRNNQDLPDLVLIDGGLGQLNQAIEVFNALGITNCLLVGVAKGEGRKPGLETLILNNTEAVQKINLKPDNMALLLVNYIRDEAHRFAIKNHRLKRDKKRNISQLEQITGIGKAKRINLLNYFGGINKVKVAGIDELVKVDGINLKIATKIVNFFST